LESEHLYVLRIENYVRFVVVTAVTTKESVLWDIKFQFIPDKENYVYDTDPNQEYYERLAFTAVNMKNVVSPDIKTQLVPHRKHITSPLHSPAC
jgi:hypothetical protein